MAESILTTTSRAKTYDTDRPLFKELGLKPFETGRDKFFVGEVSTSEYTIKISVSCMPSMFWEFEIENKESGKEFTVSTGSGAMSSFWPSVKMLASGMMVVDL